MKTFLTTVALFSITVASAQTFGTVNSNTVGDVGNSAAISYLLGDINDSKQKQEEKLSEIQGSAYTSEVFLPGKLYYEDTFEGNIFYRYNAYVEEIELKELEIPGAPVKGLHRDKSLKIITADGKSFSFHTFIDKDKLTQNGYLTQLSDGKYTLYKRYDVKYTQPQKAQNSFVKAIPARFTQFSEYYYKKDGVNRIDEVVAKKGKLLKIVDPSNREAVKAFMKENNINLKNENDLIKVIAFLNK